MNKLEINLHKAFAIISMILCIAFVIDFFRSVYWGDAMWSELIPAGACFALSAMCFYEVRKYKNK